MKLDKEFVVYGKHSEAGEEYEIEIPAIDAIQAAQAGQALCRALGLTFMTVFEMDWK